MLAPGRRLRIDENAYCVVGRRLTDCDALDALFASSERSRCVLLYPENYMGASVLLVTNEAPDFGDENPTISPKLEEYVQTAGSLALRFSNPDKYRQAPDGPISKLFIGATSRLIKIRENPEVDDIPIVMEAENPPKQRETNVETETASVEEKTTEQE